MHTSQYKSKHRTPDGTRVITIVYIGICFELTHIAIKGQRKQQMYNFIVSTGVFIGISRTKSFAKKDYLPDTQGHVPFNTHLQFK